MRPRRWLAAAAARARAAAGSALARSYHHSSGVVALGADASAAMARGLQAAESAAINLASREGITGIEMAVQQWARTHYSAIHLNHAFAKDCMPLGATLSLSGIEYYASAQPGVPLQRPKCGQCRSCCGSCSFDGFDQLAISYDASVPKGQCLSAHTGPSC